MAEKKLMVVIGAKASEFNRVMGQVKKDTRAISKTFTDVGRDMTAVGKSMTAAITVPIIAVGGFALKTGIEFESAFAGVRKTVNATEGELAELSDGIREMAKEIPAAATEIAGVAEAAGQLGIETDNILGFTRVMIDLGEATNMSATDAATALARLANITQMPQTEFDRLGSTVVALGNNLATTESEIVEMGLRLAGAGKQVGMTEAEILGFAGALSSVGIEAQAGGSAFSKVMVEMQLAVETGSAKLDEFANVAGMTSEEFSRAFKEDAAGAIIAFIQGLGSAEERGMSAIKVLDDMGIKEVRLRDALLRAAGAGDLFNESIAIGTQAWEENTALTTEAEQRYETTAAQIEILKNKFTDLGIELYDKIGPVLKDTIIPMADKLIEAIGKLVNWFTNLSPAVQKFLIIAAGIAAALGPVLIVAGQIATAIGTLIPIITKIIAAVKIVGAVIGGVAAGPIALIVAAIAALIAIIILAIKYWDEIMAAFKSAWEWLKDVFVKWWEGFTEFWGNLWENVKNALLAAWEWIKDMFLNYTPHGLIIQHWDTIKEFFINLWDRVKEIFGAAWEFLKDLFLRYHPIGLVITHWETIKDFFANLWERVKEIFSGAMSAIGGFITDKFNAIVGFLTGIRDKIIGVFQRVKDRVTKIWEGIVGSIKGAINSVIAAINGMIGRINRISVTIPDWVPEYGGKTIGFNISKIPYLAAGGDILRAGAAIVGERGPEMVYLPQGAQVRPLDTRQEIRHTGTIRVEGVNDKGQLSAVVDIVIEQLLQEVRA